MNLRAVLGDFLKVSCRRFQRPSALSAGTKRLAAAMPSALAETDNEHGTDLLAVGDEPPDDLAMHIKESLVLIFMCTAWFTGNAELTGRLNQGGSEHSQGTNWPHD